MTLPARAIGLTLFLALIAPAAGQPLAKQAEKAGAPALGGMRLRSIGPALTSGRIVDIAVDPRDTSTYYVAAASGGVWKTTNAGTTWTPIFDNEGSFSIGFVVLDPKNPNVVWVGSGENNSQRSVAYGDGVYKSEDAGRTWKNVGLKQSAHIGKILIDPRDSNIVYVAAQGPLWGPGGDRGLYKTLDGGKTWSRILAISENTGINDVVCDPRNPNIMLASAYQRRRHVWTLINGGPESGLYRSVDAGATWAKLRSGLPGEEMGRIGLAVAPNRPDTVYATIEAADKKGGIFRSQDFGITWEKRNPFDQQAQYYAHLYIDPHNADRVYVMSVLIQVSDDGGKTLGPLGERFKHVDNHVIWINPKDPAHYRVGCDGGIYESFDRAANWTFHANLPITQFYDVTVDNQAPFYTVYGGTQDNFTLGGPARTKSVHGIMNQDWFVTQDGDGFQTRVDPTDPNIIYSEMQYGGLVRFDRRTGERVGIQPQPGKGEPPLRWNWDSPLLISPHSSSRIYFAANKLFRSDDRGDSWRAISPDLTRQLNRDELPVMGKVWGPDAVAKHLSTSFYGNSVALAESPKKEGLLYLGTDDGLIQISPNGGQSWKKVDTIPGVPDRTYVSRIIASQHEAGVVYASFDNHKNNDFTPFILRSADAGSSWTSIRGDLPANGPVLAIAEDPVDPNLLFVGTEFGLFFTTDRGKAWRRLKNGLPTIAVRDLAIQKQMNDLVVGTFGRGIYIMDDYSPLRSLRDVEASKQEHLFPTRDAWMYVPTRQYGLRGKAFLGSAFFTADNPAYGATLTYYLPEAIKSRKELRKEAEKAAEKAGTRKIATRDELRAEEEEEPSQILLLIQDGSGHPVRQLTGPTAQGLHRVTWDLRSPTAGSGRVRGGEVDDDPFAQEPGGPLVMPGSYRVSLFRRDGGTMRQLGQSRELQVRVEGSLSTSQSDRKQLAQFQQEIVALQRAATGALESAQGLATRMEQIKKAIDLTPTLDRKWRDATLKLEAQNRKLLRALRGDTVLRARYENTEPSILERIGEAASSSRLAIAKPTGTSRESYRIASEELAEIVKQIRAIHSGPLAELEQALEAAGAPWTPGRLPAWKSK